MKVPLSWLRDYVEIKISPEALAERFAEIWAVDDATVDRRREEADRVCRARYTVDVVGRQLLGVLRELE